MGFMSPGDKPLIWRGPMLHSVMQQFLRGVAWGELDFLIIDLPPGTGDMQLSLVQTTPIAGAIIVTTPSEVAMEDARKAVRMFEQVKTPIIGLVENMSYLMTSSGERIDVFGEGGGQRMAAAMNIPFLVELPLDPKVRIGGDSGQPAALDPAGTGAPFHALAEKVAAAMAGPAKTGPKITLED